MSFDVFRMLEAVLRWGVGANRGRTTLVVLACAVALVACGDDDDESATTSTSSSTSSSSTTSTTTEPQTPEEEVEAAYLRSWDVYAKAVRDLDPTGLEETFAERSLETVRADVSRLRSAGTPALIDVEHDYSIQVRDSRQAIVLDEYINRSVLVDARTGRPTERESPEAVVKSYQLERLRDGWKVVLITVVES